MLFLVGVKKSDVEVDIWMKKLKVASGRRALLSVLDEVKRYVFGI